MDFWRDMKRFLITGGGGFLGKTIMKQLLNQPHTQIQSLSRSHYPELTKMGIQTIQMDLCEPNMDQLVEILRDIDVIFHVAAKAGVWGSKQSFLSINVTGTKNLLEAAQKAGVSKFIYTSSPSAVWNGGNEMFLSEQDCPYPLDHEYLTWYPLTKAYAEKMVLEANTKTFATTALRPHLIWGPEDPHLIPRVIERHKKLRIVGDGKNKVGLTYVENAAYAHILAEKTLEDHTSPNAGKAYFITDLEPVLLWDWLNQLLVELGYPTIKKQISSTVAYRIGSLLEWIWKLCNLSGEPVMTRFVAKQLSSSHYYDLSAAKNDFGYTEKVPKEEAWHKTISYFSKHSTTV